MARTATRSRTAAAKPTARKATPAKPAPAKTSKAAVSKVDAKLQVYAEKAPTELHKAFARFAVEVIGFVPEEMPTKRAAFLKGVSLAMAARQQFQGSDWLAEWREENGMGKPGRKRADEDDLTDESEVEEDIDDADEEDGEEEAVDLDALEEELNTLQIGKLRAAAKEYGVELKQGMKKADIIEAILESVEAEAEEADEDEEGEEEELDLEALEAEMEEMDLPDLKAFLKEEFEIEAKPRERKGPLIQRALDLLAEEEESEEDDEPEDEEEEEAPPARGRKAATKSKKDDYLF